MTQEQATELLKYIYDIKTGVIILVFIGAFRFVSAIMKGELR